MSDYWTVKETATAWGITAMRVRQLVPRIVGAEMRIVNGRALWFIPAGTKKPECRRPGRRRKTPNA